jgi:hypothetical protein
MDSLDKFIKSVGWKFPKGYPDMNDPKDKAMLFELAEDFMGEIIINEAQIDYNVRIRKALGLKEGDKIPTCNTPLKLGEDFNLGGEDEEIWKILYPILPLKKDSEVPTAGAGKGEIATYWAFEFNVNKHNVTDSRKGEDPDLTIDGIGCEIKSYETSNITLGKFAGDKENVALLNKVFGILTLFSKFDEDAQITINPGNFKARDIVPAFAIMATFEKNKSLRDIDMFEPLYARIDSLYSKLDLSPDASAEEGAAKLLKRVLSNKLMKKPRMGKDIGYILNVSENGKGKFYTMNDAVVDAIDVERILNGVYVSSSELGMNFKNLFLEVLTETDLGHYGTLEDGTRVPLDFPIELNETEYNLLTEETKKKIGKPMRSSSGGKAYKVYVRDPKTKKIKTVRFGSGGLKAKINNSKARQSIC